MAAKTGNAGSGKNANLPIIIVAVVVLIAFLGWWGYKNFGPQPDIKTAEGVVHDQWLDKIAKESGGDISKLSPTDVEKLQKQNMGHGDTALKAYAREHGYAK